MKGGVVSRPGAKLTTAFCDNAAQETSSSRAHHESRFLVGAAGLSEEGHVAGISPQHGNVRVHPFQCGDDVQEAIVPGRTRLFCELRMCQPPERSYPIVEGNDDNSLLGQPVTPVKPRRTGTTETSPTVDIDHYGKPLISFPGRGPYIQVKTVLAVTLHHPRQRGALLHAGGFESRCIEHTAPSRWRPRRSPAQIPYGRCSKRNSPINHQTIFGSTAYEARLNTNSSRLSRL